MEISTEKSFSANLWIKYVWLATYCMDQVLAYSHKQKDFLKSHSKLQFWKQRHQTQSRESDVFLFLMCKQCSEMTPPLNSVHYEILMTHLIKACVYDFKGKQETAVTPSGINRLSSLCSSDPGHGWLLTSRCPCADTIWGSVPLQSCSLL